MPSSWLIGNSTYLLHLVQEKHVSWSVFNQTVAALRFLYEVTLDRAGVMVRIRCPKQPKRLPINSRRGDWRFQAPEESPPSDDEIKKR